jgi:MoaA/NifB/PqqE/SkfB family radical SAM enzyme
LGNHETNPARPQCTIKDYKNITVGEIKSLVAGRAIYIFGGLRRGRSFFSSLNRTGFKVHGFLETAGNLIGKEWEGIPIVDSASFLSKNNLNQEVFIFVATGFQMQKEVYQILIDRGFVPKKDFISIRDIAPFSASIEVSGVCNLKCIACPRGGGGVDLPKGGFMTAENYKKVIGKMVEEIPFIRIVDLYTWGDPLLNPELPEIIKISNEAGVGCAISTNLNIGKNIEEIVRANPQEIRVSVSGFGPEHYEVTHTGGKWETLYSNMIKLSECIKKHNQNTAVEVWYHVNKNNLSEYKAMHDFCAKLGFVLHKAISKLFPCYVMDYIEKKPLGEGAAKAKDMMVLGLDEMMDFFRTENKKTCSMIYAFPNINWDMSVLTCCNYPYDVLAPNYLETPMDKLIELRNGAALCHKCVDYSLHRYFTGPAFMDYVDKLIYEKNGIY